MRVETIGDATLYLGDCLEILPTLGKVDAVVTDPPYPNQAGYFLEGVPSARHIFSNPIAGQYIVFWDDIEVAPVKLPLVARHSWHRTNTNRPDNCEAIYEFNVDAKRRASKVLPFCVIAPGLTGIVATGHPTEKNVGLMEALITRTNGTVLDPFMGSGTTGVACANLGRKFIGIEIEEKYFDIACRRIETAYLQPRLFEDVKPEPKNLELDMEAP